MEPKPNKKRLTLVIKLFSLPLLIFSLSSTAFGIDIDKCSEAKLDRERIQRLQHLHAKHSEDPEFALGQLEIFLDSTDLTIDRLVIGAFLTDLGLSPAIYRMVGALAPLVAETYSTGYGGSRYEILCDAGLKFPRFFDAYSAFTSDSVQGDKTAVQILDSINEDHPGISWLYARILLHSYTHRDYSFAKESNYLDYGMDHLITTLEAGKIEAGSLPNFYVNRIRDCLTADQISQLEDLDVDLGWGVSFLDDFDLFQAVAPKCMPLLNKVQRATLLSARNKKASNNLQLGRSSSALISVLRGEGRARFYRNYTLPLCNLARSLLLESAIAGDMDATILYLEHMSGENEASAKAISKYGFFGPVPEEELSTSCKEDDPGNRLQVLESLYERDEATDKYKIEFAFSLERDKQITRAGSILYEVARDAKDSQNTQVLFSINDYIETSERLRNSFFAKKISELLLD